MSERDDRPVDESSRENAARAPRRDAEEGGGPSAVGALDGAAAAGSAGGVGGRKPDSLIPQGPPDPSIGPD